MTAVPAATPAGPGWLPPLFAALLVLPFDPWWLGAEAARRAWFLVLLGALMLALPRTFTAAAAGSRWLLLLLGWGVLAALVHGGGTDPAAALLRLLHLGALLLVLRLGAATGGLPWQRAFAGVCLLTSLFGLLQRLGLAALGGYGLAHEPVSVFGNLNVAAEFTAVAGAAAAVAFPAARPLAAAALLAAGAYALANGSRSALVALPIAVLWTALWPGRSRRDRLGPLVALACGAALGLAVLAAAPEAGGGPALPGDRTATVEVRLHIAGSGLAMVGDAPLFGVGPGQFAVEYPRYRSQEEIELSSFGRREERLVGSAHDDWLETAIEGGLPALLLLGAFFWSRWRNAAGRRGDLAPLLALGLLMLVRSPLGNAPAAAAALLAAAGPRALPLAAPAVFRELTLRLLGLGAAALGVVLLLFHDRLADYLRRRGDRPLGEPARLEAALELWPHAPQVWQLLAAERRARAEDRAGAERALAAIGRAIALRPHEPSYRLMRAELLLAAGHTGPAKEEIKEAARFDPGDPRLHLQLAGIYFTERNLAATVQVLYTDPPPRLRETLADQFEQFADIAQREQDFLAERRMLAEANFVRTLDSTGADDQVELARAHERFRVMERAFRNAGLERDARLLVVVALLALDIGNRGDAVAAGEALAAAEPLPPWMRLFLQPELQRLADIPQWAHLTR